MSRPSFFCKLWVAKPGGGELCSRTFSLKSQVADETQTGPLLDLEFKVHAERCFFGTLSKSMIEEYGGYEKLKEDWSKAYQEAIAAMDRLVETTEELGGYKDEF